ncbi:ArgS-related anticodon-binding protein NrtL [Streptomyces sp. enrichment culture]|uniref:ArgS-related anticodon-binding protein NrtL n=1 Tax=Streptomyces sp. enrichment culture TaxID=1795815 RepID=UPI003F5625CB
MTPADLTLTVLHAVRRAVGDGVLAIRDVPSRVTVERPRPGGRGDWATNAALQLARPAALPPRQVAEVLRERLLDAPGIERVDITGPGFLNLTLRPDARAAAGRLLVQRVREEGLRYGYGDALSRLPEAQVRFVLPYGADLRQQVLTHTVVALLRSQGAPARLVQQDGPRHDAPHPDAPRHGTLQSGTPQPGAPRHGAPQPGTPGHGAPHEGTPQAAAPQPDAPSHGTLQPGTPQAVAPHPDAPRHGTPQPDAPRHGAPQPPVPHTQPLRLRPHPPHYDVAAVLPPDAQRWAMLRPAAHDRVLDPEPLLRLTETSGNTLFTVQYAHARAAALLRNAADLGFGPAYDEDVHAPELVAALGDHPSVLLAAARQHAPDRLARHLEALADAFLGFQHTVLPLGEEKPSAAHRSRLALAEAAGTVLAGGLSLLGVSAPAHL